jgi:group I intron endonuclease
MKTFSFDHTKIKKSPKINRHKYISVGNKKKYTSIGGIYKIECTETKSVYIGQSLSIDSRIQNHITNLRSGKHVVTAMQIDYKKHGESYFIFEAIHESDEQNLLSLETFYIDQFAKEGYNIYNSVRVTDNIGLVQCDKENSAILQKISNMLDEGKIKKGELEEAIFYKQNQF